MSEQRFWRQTDIVDCDKLQTPITIVGAGAIGSFTCLALAKMGCENITVYDFDTIEDHNLPNQFYREQDIGKDKVEGLKDLIKDFTGVEIVAKKEKYENQPITGIVLAAVDNMKSRKEIWDKIKFDPNVRLYLDGRMGAEVMRIYTTKPCDITDIEMYEANLYDDDHSKQEKCTAKAIIYNVTVIGGFIANNLKKFVMGEEYLTEIIFDLKNMLLLRDGA